MSFFFIYIADSLVYVTLVFYQFLKVRIIPFRTASEAIEGANGTMYGLSASIWCNDVSLAHTVADQLNAG